MTYKRQLWTSGYEYRVRCPYCGTHISYNDRQLGYRSWFPNGFVYCPGCRRPIRHNELFAVKPDGSPVFRTQEEANRSVYDGYNRALGLDPTAGIDVVSCPTCGRTKIDLIPLLAAFEKGLDERGLRKKKLKVAFMGCAVNGPGEAREADIGIAGGDGEALLFKRGETIAKYPADRIVEVLLDEIEKSFPT